MNFEVNMSTFGVSVMNADGLAPLGVRTSRTCHVTNTNLIANRIIKMTKELWKHCIYKNLIIESPCTERIWPRNNWLKIDCNYCLYGTIVIGMYMQDNVPFCFVKRKCLIVVPIAFGGHKLQWRHNGLDGVSNHQPHPCLLSRLFGRRSKKTSKLHVTGFCAWNSRDTGKFPAQMASNAENVSIWWRHHEICCCSRWW